MKLPAHFRFSWTVTTVSVTLALVMLWCSNWQWRRYHEKKALVATYEAMDTAIALPFPASGTTTEDFASVLDRKVSVSGTWDYDHQFVVTNRRNADGPGHWLMTPLRLDGSPAAVLVSRGFIPFEDRDPASWEKYRFAPTGQFQAVVKRAQSKKLLGPGNPDPAPGQSIAPVWYFVEAERAAERLPYPLITPVFLQHLGPPPSGRYPEQSISIEVPPQVHFGYTIEWILLALATLAIGLAIQAWPWRRKASTRFDP